MSVYSTSVFASFISSHVVDVLLFHCSSASPASLLWCLSSRSTEQREMQSLVTGMSAKMRGKQHKAVSYLAFATHSAPPLLCCHSAMSSAACLLKCSLKSYFLSLHRFSEDPGSWPRPQKFSSALFKSHTCCHSVSLTLAVAVSLTFPRLRDVTGEGEFRNLICHSSS